LAQNFSISDFRATRLSFSCYALTMQNQVLSGTPEPECFPERSRWEADGKQSPALRLRRALAFPVYAVALAMAFSSDLLGSLAAKIVGDD
jgi:hypothetical protein